MSTLPARTGHIRPVTVTRDTLSMTPTNQPFFFTLIYQNSGAQFLQYIFCWAVLLSSTRKRLASLPSPTNLVWSDHSLHTVITSEDTWCFWHLGLQASASLWTCSCEGYPTSCCQSSSCWSGSKLVAKCWTEPTQLRVPKWRARSVAVSQPPILRILAPEHQPVVQPTTKQLQHLNLQLQSGPWLNPPSSCWSGSMLAEGCWTTPTQLLGEVFQQGSSPWHHCRRLLQSPVTMTETMMRMVEISRNVENKKRKKIQTSQLKPYMKISMWDLCNMVRE